MWMGYHSQMIHLLTMRDCNHGHLFIGVRRLIVDRGGACPTGMLNPCLNRIDLLALNEAYLLFHYFTDN